jgi:isopenicillin N synthase-like dioxygenase
MSRVVAIDLADFRCADARRHEAFVADLRTAMLDVGFVRVIGHSIPPALSHEVRGLFERFFSQPDEVKARCGGVAGGQRGFTAFGIEHAKDSAVADLKEFFHVGQEGAGQKNVGLGAGSRAPSKPGSKAGRAHLPNVWPQELPVLRDASLLLYRALENCAHVLLEALAEGFALPAQAFSGMLDGGNSILRALHYPPVPADADPDALRAAPHEDINLLTLLCEASDSGLEIFSQGSWVPVESHPGEIVADAGDMLSRVSNGRIPSTTHRVIADAETRGRHRYALPFFAHPRPECDLSVMPDFLEPGESPRHPPITAEAFLTERLREIGLAS